MRIKEIKVYKFDELSDKAKDKVLENLSDINTDYDWWDSIYDDATQIGLDITEFDIYQRMIHGKFLESAEDVANKIINGHGKKTETYKDAVTYLDSLKIIKDSLADSEEDDELDTGDIDDEFLYSLLQDYLSMLEEDYDYQTSKEAVIETIEANDYEFTEDGKLS